MAAKRMECPFCGEDQTLRGLNGHLKFKHGLNQEEANLITSGEASEEDIEGILETLDVELKKSFDSSETKSLKPIEDKESSRGAMEIVEHSDLVIKLVDNLEKIREKKTSIHSQGFLGLKWIVLSTSSKAALEALEDAEDRVSSELVALCGEGWKETEEEIPAS